MSWAENVTGFTGNMIPYFFQEEKAVLANLEGQSFKILSGALNQNMVDPPTSQIIWPPYIKCLSMALEPK